MFGPPLLDGRVVGASAVISREDGPENRTPLRVVIFPDSGYGELIGSIDDNVESIRHSMACTVWCNRSAHGGKAIANFLDGFRSSVSSKSTWPATRLPLRLPDDAVADCEVKE